MALPPDGRPRQRTKKTQRLRLNAASATLTGSPRASTDSRAGNSSHRSAAEILRTTHLPVQLLPYQQRWVEDDSPLKIVVKGRQTGYSFCAAFRAVLSCLEGKTTWIFLSKGERQSRLLMEKVQEHAESCGIFAEVFERDSFEGTTIKQLETRFPNGSVIYGLPANPDTARGYSGNVTLDEFAFHADADKIYTSLYPTITRGFTLEVISTPNGQQGKFYELAKAADLVDGVGVHPRQAGTGPDAPLGDSLTVPKWSGHKTSIYDAVAQGLQIDIDRLRAGVDDETWRQEFCCEFLSGGSQWISPELFQQCVSSEATTVLGAGDWGLGKNPSTEHPAPSTLYAGWDIARNRDLSVIWVAELVGDVTWTRAVIEMRNLPTPDQLREARALMPLVRRMVVDKSGMGLVIYESLNRDFPGKVEGVQFTQPTKEAMAVLAKRRMEETKVRIPDDDNIRQSFRGVKKTANIVGQARFDAEHDSEYGHADHWWAFCLAETAAQRPVYHLAEIGAVIGKPVAAGMRARIL